MAEMLPRDAMERLRTVLNQVTGQPLRVCVKLESGRASVGRSSELQARFEKDPIVRAMLETVRRPDFKSQAPGRGMNHGSQSSAADVVPVPSGAGETGEADGELLVEASAGGGMVSVKMNGQKQLTEVRIEPDVFKSRTRKCCRS